MFFLIPNSLLRPNILDETKDEDYHCRFARYCLGQANSTVHNSWLSKIDKNKRFYKGDQWTTQEDVDTFLKDDDNQDRNRLQIALNVIRPMVEQYRGNAIRMNINYRIKSISPHAINRREKSLAEALHLTKVANQEGNPFGPEIKKNFPVGDSEAETRAIFQNAYVDYFVQDMNDLAKFVSERNKFVKMQEPLALQMAFSGLAVMNEFDYAGHQQFRVVPSDTFFWDRSAKKPDFSDAAFMGEIMEMFPSEIFEQYQNINPTDREAIEKYSKYYAANTGNYTPGNSQQNTRLSNGKVPVYKVFWRDGQADEHGFVKDEYGYEYLTKINYTFEGEDKPRYTDKDLIKVNSLRAKRIFGDKLKKKLYYDVLRMAIIIPKEIIGSCDPSNNDQNKYNDIVLDWGKYNYQETENIEYDTVKYPYKCWPWSYVDGEVLSPIDDAIDPQRFINRIFSMAENQLNNSGGSGTIIDKDLVDDESEVNRNMNQSKPVFVRAKGRGIQNVVGSYDNTRSTGAAEQAFNIIGAMKASIKETTGVNDAIQGQQTGNGNDQLVGVTELMIQRGSLMQEPFYTGITMVFEQCFNSICSRGKRIYIDNERELTISVGDNGARVLKLSKDLLPEDFRTFVKRENSDEILVQTANAQLLQFKQLMMLDDKRVANLWGRSTPDMVANALREYAMEKEEIQRMAQKDQNAQQTELQRAAQIEQKQNNDAYHEQAAREDIRHLTDKNTEIKKEVLKNIGKIAPQNRAAQNLILNSAKNL